jgi:hypothetical protein
MRAECFTRWATEAVATAKQLRQEAKEAVTAATALRSELAAQRLERQEQRWQMQEEGDQAADNKTLPHFLQREPLLC